HPIMDHQSWSDEAGFAGNEDDPAPVLLKHARKICPRQPDSAENIDLEVSSPILVGDVGKVLDLVDAEIVDQNIHDRRRLDQRRSTFRHRWISQDAVDLGTASDPNTFNRL